MNIKKYKTKLLLTILSIVLSAGIITGCGEDASSGKFVALTNKGDQILYSTDGISWSVSTLPNTDSNTIWNSVCYGDGKFVAIGYDSTRRIVTYSTDGIDWKPPKPLPGNNTAWISICYGNGKFVAVGIADPSYAAASYSTDGINWTLGTGLVGWELRNVCYGNGMFVAVCDEIIAYSTDGITWTSENTMEAWNSGCYGKGRFVLIADNYTAYSTDRTTWISKTGPSGSWGNICYGNGTFIAVGENRNTAAYSTDGINWQNTTMSISIHWWYSVCYGNGKFIAVGYRDHPVSTPKIGIAASSADGIHWEEIKLPISTPLGSITYGFDKDIFGFL